MRTSASFGDQIISGTRYDCLSYPVSFSVSGSKVWSSGWHKHIMHTLLTLQDITAGWRQDITCTWNVHVVCRTPWSHVKDRMMWWHFASLFPHSLWFIIQALGIRVNIHLFFFLSLSSLISAIPFAFWFALMAGIFVLPFKSTHISEAEQQTSH